MFIQTDLILFVYLYKEQKIAETVKLKTGVQSNSLNVGPDESTIHTIHELSVITPNQYQSKCS